MKLTLPLVPFFLLTFSLGHFVHAMDLDCPPTVYVELGKNGTINCQILNNGDVYWYKGNSTKTSPIVRLENGQKKISQESNRYDIDDEGSLIIKEIEEQNYGVYSVVNFYANDKHVTDQIKVEIAVKPQTLCPIIAGCNDCDHCILTKSETGNISCSIFGTRPHLHLNIVTDSDNWIHVIRNVSEETHDPVTDTWSTTATIQYSEWYDCRSPLHLRCVTENKQPFELSDSVAHLISDSCKTTTQISGHHTPFVEDTKRMYLFAIIIIVVVIFVVIVLVLGIVLCRKSETYRNRKESKARTNKEDIEMQEQRKKLLQKKNTPADDQGLLDILKNAYKDLQLFATTQNGDNISTDEVFQGINFTLTKADSNDNITSSSEMIDMLFGKDRNFVFVDDSEFGRKAFVQYVFSGLYAKDQDQTIILYISLKGLDNSMTIADAIDKQMLSDRKFSTDIIRNILKTQNCLFLFDEVHELNQSHIDETQNSENQHPGEVTIKDVLSGSYLFQGYKKSRSLCISNTKINVTSLFTEQHVFIKIEQFSPANLKLYVASIFNCYQKLHDRNITVLNEKTGGTVDEVDKNLPVVSTQESVEQNTTCVTDIILDKENMINEMNMCPSLLILFIHLLVSDIMKKEIDNLIFYIHRKTYLTKLFLDCLQFSYSLHQAVNEDFEDLMLKFGEASFEKSVKEMSFTDKCDLIPSFERTKVDKIDVANFDTALAMGFLKPGKDSDSGEDISNNVTLASPDSLVEFRHMYIQEYSAAKAIVSSETAEQKFLTSPALNKDERMKRILQFMYLTEDKNQYKMLKQFLDGQKWNILIDCLFEWDNDEHYEKIRSAISSIISKYSVNIIDMDKLYHCMAVCRFCADLSTNKVSLKALTFRNACKSEHFCKLQIPAVSVIVFFEIDFHGEDNFISFVKKLCQLKVLDKIQFVQCKCPDKITEENMRDVLKDVPDKSSPPKILRTNAVVSNAFDPFALFDSKKWEKLNYTNGCWE